MFELAREINLLKARFDSLDKIIAMLFSDPITFKGEYTPTRFEKWQTEQMNKDYLIFKENIQERLRKLEDRVDYLMNQVGDFNEEISPMEVKQCPVNK